MLTRMQGASVLSPEAAVQISSHMRTARPAPHPRIRLRAAALAAVLAAATWLGGCRAAPARPPAEITVSAASDLMEALPELAAAFERETGVHVVTNYGSSGQLAQQIAEGAPVDVFMSADIHYMEELGDAGLMLRGTRAIFGTGKLVVWTPPDGPALTSLQDLAQPRFRKVALANPKLAPYGHAAEEALRMAGLWNAVKGKAVFGENVRQALLYVRNGSADAALVANTLVEGRPGHVLVVPEELYPRMYATIGVVRDTRNEPAARTFAAFVTGAEWSAILARHGFAPPPDVS